MPVRPPLTRYRRKKDGEQRSKRPYPRLDMRQVRRLLNLLSHLWRPQSAEENLI
jgi:hypothetical protein